MWPSDARPRVYAGDLRHVANILLLAGLIGCAFFLPKLGAFLMRKLPIAAVIGLCLAFAGCAQLTAEQALATAGLTIDAYCKLAPEGRAEIRARANLPHLVNCPGDPSVVPR